MSDIKLKLRRGPKDTIPTLEEGELGYTTDSKDLYIGTSDGNKQINGGGDAIVDAVSYKDAKTTQLYRTTATENLTRAEHTESEYTPNPSKYYKVLSTVTFDSDKALITGEDNCTYFIPSITNIDSLAEESTADDYDFYLDTNGGYYPKNLHKTYLIRVGAPITVSTYKTDYTTNTITAIADNASISYYLNNYPVNNETTQTYWMNQIFNLYNIVQYYKMVAVSDDDIDLSIQKYIDYEETNYTYFVIHPYSNCAYLIRKTEDSSDNDTNTISYKDESSKSMIQLATPDDITNRIELSQTLEKLTAHEMILKITNSELIPGHNYRITDYNIQISTSSNISNYVKVADTTHYFDIIVTATSANSISKDAHAIVSDTDTTGYYNNARLFDWKLEVIMPVTSYIESKNNALNHNITSLYNNNNMFIIITKMIDEFGNECPYDFKNIVMKRYEITADSTGTITTDDFADGRFFTIETEHTGWTIDTTNPKWLYTYSYIDGNDKIEDLTIKYPSWNSLEMFDISQFGNNIIDSVLDPESIIAKSNCYILSNKKNTTPTTFAYFIFINNKIINSVGSTINNRCCPSSDSGVLTNNNYSGNIILNSNDVTLIPSIDGVLTNRYIMNNTSGTKKVFNIADLVTG